MRLKGISHLAKITKITRGMDTLLMMSLTPLRISYIALIMIATSIMDPVKETETYSFFIEHGLYGRI